MRPIRPALEAALLQALLNLPEGLQRRLVRRPVVLDGQELAPELQLMLALRRLVRDPLVEDLDVAGGRSLLSRSSGLTGGRQPIGALRDLTVDGAEGPLPARLYTPTSRLGAEQVPTLMFFHGGGWVYGDLESHDAACRHLAEASGVQVLAVDYRLAPEHPYPGALDDCESAFRWLVAHADEVGADPRRLAVGGDSAGGNLAALVALMAGGEDLPLAFQLLVYPATDFSERSRSRELFGEGFFLTDKFMDQCSDWYLVESDRSDPRASVLLTTSFPETIAPALVVTAGFDPLRDEGEAYAELLEKFGVDVELRRYPDMIHGFFNIVGAGHRAPSHNREIAAKLRDALS